MFGVSHLFARVFSRLNDGRHTVALSLDESGEKLRFQVFSAEGSLYEGFFEECEMETMKGGCNPALAWGSFFELVQKAFAENTLDFNPAGGMLKLTLKHERQNDVIPLPPFTSSLQLVLTRSLSTKHNDEAIRDLCDNMISYVALRSGDKREVERLEQVSRMESALADEAQQLKDEVNVLEKELARRRQQANYAAVETQRLLADPSITSLPFNAAEALKAVVDNQDMVDLVTCRVPDPLKPITHQLATAPGTFSPYCKSFDHELFRLIKSSYCIANDVPMTHHSCDVLQPFAPEDMTEERVQSILNHGLRRRVWNAIEVAQTQWDFDVFQFDSDCQALVTSGGPDCKGGALFVLGYALLYRTGGAVKLNMSEQRLLQWLSALENSYRPETPFHNALHAADVLQAVAFLMNSVDPKKARLRHVDVVSTLIAAIIIDVNHAGRDNDFYRKTNSHLSSAFADASVTESMHVAYAFELMKLPRYNILSHVEESLREQVERSVSIAVKATDKLHLEPLLATFRLRMHEDRELASSEDLDLLCALFLRVADDAFMARRLDVYKKWVLCMRKERMLQGDAEEQSKVQPSPLMGRALKSQVELAKLQLSLINYSAIPLYSAVMDIVPTLCVTGEQFAKNRETWINAEQRDALGEVIIS